MRGKAGIGRKKRDREGKGVKQQAYDELKLVVADKESQTKSCLIVVALLYCCILFPRGSKRRNMSMNWAVPYPGNMSKGGRNRAVVIAALFFLLLVRQFKLVSMIRYFCLFSFSTVPFLIACTGALWVCRSNTEHT